MRILILNWRDPKNPKSGGAEFVTREHAKAWVKAGHAVTWFTSRYPNAPTQEVLDGIKIIRHGSWLTVYFLAPFCYFFSGQKFDLVVDEFHGLPFFTPLYVRRPKIALVHEVADDIWNYMYPFPFNILGRSLEFLYFRLYGKTKFWTDAKSTAEDLKKYGITQNNCTIIPCAISNVVLNKLPQKEKNPTFIFVSRLVKMKGIEEVIKAFSFVEKELADSKLWIVGSGEKEYLQELKQMIKEYDIEKNVIFYGQVTDGRKIELMQRANLLLHASVKEGWGLVVIEASSQATPSIVYNVAGLRDSVKNDITGIVLRDNSPYEMAHEALLLLKNKNRYRKLQENALNWAKNLTWEKATQASLKLIKDVKISETL